MGIALMPKDGKDFQTLYNCSDDAMYMAKNMERAVEGVKGCWLWNRIFYICTI